MNLILKISFGSTIECVWPKLYREKKPERNFVFTFSNDVIGCVEFSGKIRTLLKEVAVLFFQPAPASYRYDWNVVDTYSGNDFGAEEARTGYKADGGYTVLLPDGRKQVRTSSTFQSEKIHKFTDRFCQIFGKIVGIRWYIVRS